MAGCRRAARHRSRDNRKEVGMDRVEIGAGMFPDPAGAGRAAKLPCSCERPYLRSEYDSSLTYAFSAAEPACGAGRRNSVITARTSSAGVTGFDRYSRNRLPAILGGLPCAEAVSARARRRPPRIARPAHVAHQSMPSFRACRCRGPSGRAPGVDHGSASRRSRR